MTDIPYAISVTTSVVFAVALLCAAVIAASTALSREQQKWPRLRAPALAAYAEPLIDLVETTLMQKVVAAAGGNRTAAAKLLGLDRATLRSKLDR